MKAEKERGIDWLAKTCRHHCSKCYYRAYGIIIVALSHY